MSLSLPLLNVGEHKSLQTHVHQHFAQDIPKASNSTSQRQELWGDPKLLDRLLYFDKDNIPPDVRELKMSGEGFLCAFCAQDLPMPMQ